jgi:succinate-acetate transporter protein
LLWTVSLLWHLMHKLAATSVPLMLVAVLVLLELLVALTCGYLVSNNAVRGPGGNHGVHCACVSCSDSFASKTFSWWQSWLYYLFVILLECALISWWDLIIELYYNLT